MAEELVFRIPSKLKEFIDSFPDVKWSDVAKESVFSEYKRLSLSKFVHRLSEFNGLDKLLKRLSKEYVGWESTKSPDSETIEFKVPWSDKTKNISEFPDVDWSRVVIEALDDRFKRELLLKSLDDILNDSKLTKDDALRLGRLIKKGRFEWLKKEGWV